MWVRPPEPGFEKRHARHHGLGATVRSSSGQVRGSGNGYTASRRSPHPTPPPVGMLLGGCPTVAWVLATNCFGALAVPRLTNPLAPRAPQQYRNANWWVRLWVAHSTRPAWGVCGRSARRGRHMRTICNPSGGVERVLTMLLAGRGGHAQTRDTSNTTGSRPVQSVLYTSVPSRIYMASRPLGAARQAGLSGQLR